MRHWGKFTKVKRGFLTPGRLSFVSMAAALVAAIFFAMQLFG